MKRSIIWPAVLAAVLMITGLVVMVLNLVGMVDIEHAKAIIMALGFSAVVASVFSLRS